MERSLKGIQTCTEGFRANTQVQLSEGGGGLKDINGMNLIAK